jgi:hypothetical protein
MYLVHLIQCFSNVAFQYVAQYNTPAIHMAT